MSFANLNKSADTCKFFHANTINNISWSICSILRYHSGQRKMWSRHGVKSVQILNFFWSVFSCIWTEYMKIRTKNNSVFGHFMQWEKLCSNMIFEMQIIKKVSGALQRIMPSGIPTKSLQINWYHTKVNIDHKKIGLYMNSWRTDHIS